jgi:GTP-dependent phosphoenolpyruvate carboxykinase
MLARRVSLRGLTIFSLTLAEMSVVWWVAMRSSQQQEQQQWMGTEAVTHATAPAQQHANALNQT